MNQRTELLTNNYKPVVAISVYRSTDETSGNGKYYLESHDINETGQIMQGKPLLQETIQDIVEVFFDERKNLSNVTGMLPENLLSFVLLPGGKYKMVWFRPAEIKVIYFATALKISTAKSWVPAMVYVADNFGLDVFALKTNARPKETTRLCYAPFFNVNTDGAVCLGNAKVKIPTEKTYTNLMKYWEDLFWLSEFTHVNGNDTKTITQLQPLWQKIMKSKCRFKWNESKELKQYPKLNIKQLL
jgi:PRTRC genetic system protein B